MSSQRGNVRRTRPQKYKNQTAFKNNMHDTSKQIKEVNDIKLISLCPRCEQIIQWKIKYKKYRPLTQLKVCIKCNQKAVKQAYYTICIPCSTSLKICAKCGQSGEIVTSAQENQAEINQKFENACRCLKERERRTLLRIAQTNGSAGDSGHALHPDHNESVRGATSCLRSDSSDFDSSDGDMSGTDNDDNNADC